MLGEQRRGRAEDSFACRFDWLRAVGRRVRPRGARLFFACSFLRFRIIENFAPCSAAILMMAQLRLTSKRSFTNFLSR